MVTGGMNGMSIGLGMLQEHKKRQAIEYCGTMHTVGIQKEPTDVKCDYY
jgi:hypothetical protein